MSDKQLRYQALSKDEKRVVDHWINVTRGDLGAISPMVLRNLRESHARGFKEDAEIATNMITAYDREHGREAGGRSH